MTWLVLGIDPGLSGALAMLPGGDLGQVLVHDMPTLTLSRSGKAKRRINTVELAGLFDFGFRPPDLVILEQPFAPPGQSSSATFDTGRSFGIVEGLAATLRCRVEIVHPAAWKRQMQVPAAKDGAIARASQLMPQNAKHWPLKKHDGRAEAALLALYGHRLLRREATGNSQELG